MCRLTFLLPLTLSTTSTLLACDAGREARSATGLERTGAQLLNPGDLVITEIMADPDRVADHAGEWLELQNLSGEEVDLLGLEVSDSKGTGFTVDRSLLVPAGGHVVLGRNGNPDQNGGVAADFDWPGSFALANGSDDLVLSVDGVVLDAVAWDDGATFPDVGGASMSLDPSRRGRQANDDGAAWCAATSAYGHGDKGTPGGANDDCELLTLGLDEVSAGELVVTEIMADPSAVADRQGEWLELHNLTEAVVDLEGLEVSDSRGTGFTIDRPLPVPAGGRVVLAREGYPLLNGGVTADHDWSGSFALANGSDDLVLSFEGRLLDRVAWDDGATFPDEAGASMSLSAAALAGSSAAELNDQGASWCPATEAFGDGDLGTPGAANPTCAGTPDDADGDGWTVAEGDCDDSLAAVHPGAEEACDGLDTDCDGFMELEVPGAFATIQAALDVAEDVDLVCVEAGTYTENLVISETSPTLRGAGAGLTVVDGDGEQVLLIDQASPVVEDLTLTGGMKHEGAGLLVDYGSPTLRGVDITGNTCDPSRSACYGTAIALYGGEPVFEDLVVSDNRTDYADYEGSEAQRFQGTVLMSWWSAPTFRDVAFLDNTLVPPAGRSASHDVIGGLAYIYDGTATFEGVDFIGNELVADGVGQVDVVGGLLALAGGAEVTMSHARFLDNVVGGQDIRGGLVSATGARLGLEWAMVANNEVSEADEVDGALFRVGGDGAVGIYQGSITRNDASTTWAPVYGTVASLGCSGGGSDAMFQLDNTDLSHNIGGRYAVYTSGEGCAYGSWVEYSNLWQTGALHPDWTPMRERGNLEVNPAYRSTSGDSAADWDLRLSSGSGLVDAGAPTLSDADGSRSDIGAWGGSEGDGWD